MKVTKLILMAGLLSANAGNELTQSAVPVVTQSEQSKFRALIDTGFRLVNGLGRVVSYVPRKVSKLVVQPEYSDPSFHVEGVKLNIHELVIKNKADSEKKTIKWIIGGLVGIELAILLGIGYYYYPTKDKKSSGSESESESESAYLSAMSDVAVAVGSKIAYGASWVGNNIFSRTHKNNVTESQI